MRRAAVVLLSALAGASPCPALTGASACLALAGASAALAADAVDARTPAGTAPAAEAPKFVEKSTERGPVKARVRIEPAAPVIGDTVTMLLEVTAADGIEVMMPEFGQSLDRFSVREFVPKESVGAGGATTYTQRYVLEPPLSGPQSIPPLMIEFVDHRAGQRPAPEGEQSYELVTERIPFEVGSVLPEGASTELRPVRGQLEPLREPGRLWPWLVGIVVAAALAAAWLWRRFQAARAQVRRRSAWEVARARLDALSSRARPAAADEVDRFFVELSALIRRYLEDRFELRAPELTTEEFLQVASGSPDLRESHQRFLSTFLERADMVKFARFIPSPEDIEAALGAASRFLDETHQPTDSEDPRPQVVAGAAHA